MVSVLRVSCVAASRGKDDSMSRIIINNRSKAYDIQALKMVGEVMHGGRISGTGDKAQYCYASTFRFGVESFTVIATLNKCSDSFTVVDG
jgi:phage-related minor tail protein